MKHIANNSLYRYAVQFADQNVLPLLIRRLEPYGIQDVMGRSLPEVNSLITKTELEATLWKYQILDKYLKLGIIGLLILVAAGFSILLRVLPYFLVLLILIVCETALLLFLLGVYMTIRNRFEEWQEIMHRQTLLERIEYYAHVTSSSLIAKIVVEIEEMKKIQKHEFEKAKEYSELSTRSLETLYQALEAKKNQNKGAKSLKPILLFLFGYFGQKTLDYLWTHIRLIRPGG
jgi:hypothetical protein